MSELVLHIQEPGQPSKEVPLGASMTIGRHPDCDYVLEDGKASSRHCRVAVVDGEVSVEDLGSSNKTAIEGGPKLSDGEKHALTAGTTFRVGETVIDVKAAPGPVIEPTKMLSLDELQQGIGADAPAADGDAAAKEEDAAKQAAEEAAAKKKAAEEAAAKKKAADEAAAKKKAADEAAAKKKAAVDDAAAKKNSAAAAAETRRAEKAGIESSTASRERDSSSETIAAYGGGTIALDQGELSDLAVTATFRAANPRFVIANEAIRRVVPLTNTEFRIGRKANVDPEVHCVIEHGAVSSHHAVIRLDRQAFVLEDLGSKNGTWIDGEFLSANAKRALKSESHVRLGAIDLLFVIDADIDGGKVDAQRAPAAAEMLVRSGEATRSQVEKARHDGESNGRHVGEELLLAGIVSVEQWCKALKNAEISGLANKGGAKSSTSMALGIALVVAIIIITILVANPDILGLG